MSISTLATAAEIDAISIPVNSMDGNCQPRDTGIWSVSGSPLTMQSGISWLIDPSAPSGYGDFVLHDHHYTATYVPDATRAVVTFHFDGRVRVNGLRIMQHANGITRIEGFGGDSLGSMTSAGNVFGTKGDVTGAGVFSEFEMEGFTFTSPQEGSYFQYVITKTSLENGYASYRTYLDFEAVPEPTSIAALALGSAFIARRRRKA